ncbi:amidohydrolase family protein [Conexibacter sp. S30A1]|uniref:amidohydrolase family protein n=1 Tax=Conexibacter sp. S30A1 TaxID=2937800 RepID=UPI00200EF474|nr:amidohydrolase family protein [Conexibacter sp. S30A1]
MALDLEALTAPWLEVIRGQVPGIEIFDAHTHLGQNDPDGMRQSPAELLAQLRAARACGCFVFPMHEPDGYPPANDFVIATAAQSDGLLVPFCRVKPGEGALGEAERALTRGARGIKLHPRAERFTLDHPDIPRLFALAHERTVPILIHAGRGIPALGEHVVANASRYPNARVILAHAAVSDLAWLWRVIADLPNVLIDTAWWVSQDLVALFSLVPAAQIVFASDAPYGATAVSAAAQLRLALQAGLTPQQVALLASGQALRIARGEPLAVSGPAIGERERASHLLLDRVAGYLQVGALLEFRTGDGSEMIALARLACDVPDDVDDLPVFYAIRALLDRHAELRANTPADRTSRAILQLAAAAAMSPDVPVPHGD